MPSCLETSRGFGPLATARRWGSALLDVAFPPACVACGESTAALQERSRDFCAECLAAIAPAEGTVPCLRCATPIVGLALDAPPTDCAECRGEKWRFEATLALGPYEGLLRRLVLQAKRPGHDRLARALGGRLASVARERGFGDNAIVCPTPSHWWRRFTRGANSPDAIADGLAAGLGARLAFPLRRTRNTAKQADLAPGRRRTNVRGAFAADGARLGGATVLLVDDVLTTGATLDAAARALRAAGAERVITAVVTRRTGG